MKTDLFTKYGAGCIKNVYSDHNSLFLQIALENDVITSNTGTQIDTEIHDLLNGQLEDVCDEMETDQIVTGAMLKTTSVSSEKHTGKRNANNVTQKATPQVAKKRPTKRNI